MIRETDLQEAIAACEGEKNPNANTCYKLAAYYTIQDHIRKQEAPPNYSYSASPKTIDYEGGSEFGQAINGRSIDEILPLVDELLQTIKVIYPKLYASVMRRLD